MSLPIGTYESKLLAVHKLSSFKTISNVGGEENVQVIEQDLLVGLLNEDPTAPSEFFGDSDSSNISPEVNNHLMIHNNSNDSNIAMVYEYKSNTDVVYANSDYFEKQGIGSVYKNKVELGNDTAPLYNGNLKFEYFDGNSNFITNDHILSFDTTDASYNLHKAMNSTLSNTNSSATNGFIVDFNNGFNASKAFFTEDILQRDANDNSISSIGNLGEHGITTSKTESVAGDLNWEKFDATIVDGEPMFGALKIFRDNNPILMNLGNNVDDNSTLSKLIDGQTATTLPDNSFDSESFNNLFISNELEKIGSEYSFQISINDGEGGYSLKTDTANLLVPQYNDSNIIDIDNSISFTMATIDDTEITENAVYMKKMADQNLFNDSSHKLKITNGDLVKTPDTVNPNPNFDYFTVLNGIETLTGDLDKPGKISFVASTNTLGDINARYTKYSDTYFINPDTTRTAANSLEVDYTILRDDLKTNYDVHSTLSVLNKSTLTSGNDSSYWASNGVNGNVANISNVSLVFQETPNSALFSSTNISNFTSSVFDADKITLLSLTKKLSFENESALFKTSNNVVVSNVVSSVNITSVDLNSLGADDIRITILPKLSTDIPAPVSWNWVTGDSSDGSIAADLSPQNNNKLFSQINNNDYSAMQFYNNIHTMQPTDVLNVTFMLKTNENDMASKELLTTHPFMQIVSNGSTTELPLDSKDYVTNTPIVLVSPGLVQSLSNATGVSPGYVVTKYITTKTYTAAIRAKLGAYKNLWIVTEPVTEVTEWYQLTNSFKNNQIMPDYYLINIKDSNGNQLFKASRSFTVNSTSVKSISSGAISLNVKDLMGFKVSAQYSNQVDGNTTWNEFTLKPDSNFNNSLDLFYEYQSTITLVDSRDTSIELANVNIAVDAATGVGLGADADGSYMISLSIPSGTNSFDVVGYEYSQSDLQYLNKSVNWSPYAVGDALFLKNGTVNVGTQISNLSTNVVLSGASDPSQENSVTVTVTKDDNVLFSFVSNKYILENFNIISMPKVIVQHDYTVGTSTGTEYLLVDTSDKVELLFGNAEIVSGISALITYGYLERVNTSYFKLNGDKVLITPLEISTVTVEQYAGRYAVAEEIKPSTTGHPLPTNSLLHRNIAPTVFRGLVLADPIILTRTATTAKFTIGSNIEDNFDVDGAVVTKDKTFTVTQMMDGSTIIGELGLKFTTSFSMLPKTEGGDYIIDVLLNADTYTKTILNPNDKSIETTVTSNLFDFVLHEFKEFSLVATRIKVYDQEIYGFTRGEPPIRVYYNDNYIGDPRNIADENWFLLTTPINNALLSSNDGVTYGVVNFKKSIVLTNGFTKYCILPRPTATLSAYSITDLTGSLPYDINATRKTHHFDINLSETNKPFTGKNGLNDVSLTFSSSTTYSSFRTATTQFSFDIGSNKLKISSATGLTADTNAYTTIFEGYISELNILTKWDSFIKDGVLNATNTFSDKKWNLKLPQLKTPISFIPDTRLDEQCIHIDGITSFGMNGPYTLDLKIFDSVKMVLYKVDLQYDSVTDTEIAVFNKYSSAEGITWVDKNELTKSVFLNPRLVKRETCELPINISNDILTNTPYNIAELIKSAITRTSFSSKTWVNDSNFAGQNSPVSFTTLSTIGAELLLRIIGVTQDTPVNVLRSKRPPILDIRRADGTRSMCINHDGQLVTHKLITKRIDMEQTTVGGYAPTDYSPMYLNGIYNQNNIAGFESI